MKKYVALLAILAATVATEDSKVECPAMYWSEALSVPSPVWDHARWCPVNGEKVREKLTNLLSAIVDLYKDMITKYDAEMETFQYKEYEHNATLLALRKRVGDIMKEIEVARKRIEMELLPNLIAIDSEIMTLEKNLIKENITLNAYNLVDVVLQDETISTESVQDQPQGEAPETAKALCECPAPVKVENKSEVVNVEEKEERKDFVRMRDELLKEFNVSMSVSRNRKNELETDLAKRREQKAQVKRDISETEQFIRERSRDIVELRTEILMQEELWDDVKALHRSLLDQFAKEMQVVKGLVHMISSIRLKNLLIESLRRQVEESPLLGRILQDIETA